jgi:hypothetical protein
MDEKTIKALKESEKRIIELCRMVNNYSIKLGLGKKVNADDWADVASDEIKRLHSIVP